VQARAVHPETGRVTVATIRARKMAIASMKSLMQASGRSLHPASPLPSSRPEEIEPLDISFGTEHI